MTLERVGRSLSSINAWILKLEADLFLDDYAEMLITASFAKLVLSGICAKSDPISELLHNYYISTRGEKIFFDWENRIETIIAGKKVFDQQLKTKSIH